MFYHKLPFRLTLVFLMVALVPLGIVSMFSVRTADQVITRIVTSQLKNVAAEKRELLERWLAERKGDLEVVAGSAIVRSLDAGHIAPYLRLVQSQYKVYTRFVIADACGQVVYDTAAGGLPGAGDARDYERALEGRVHMSEIDLGPTGRESVFHLTVPIPDAEGRPKGVVRATVSTQKILAWILTVSLGKTGECYLVDRTGTFLAHKEPRRILKETIAQSESFAQIFRPARPRPVYTDYRGIPVLGASCPIAGTEWYVVVEQDRDEAFASSSRLKRNIALVIALTVGGAIGLSSLLAFYLTGPIRGLSTAADALAQGKFEEAAGAALTARRDEIGALSRAFDHMASQLKDRQSTLERRVGVTEAELRKADSKLRQAMEVAARSEHLAALGHLASGVAHEIRTPLTSLKLFLQSVQEEIDISPEHGEDYRIAMQQVDRIERTINNFLDFARPQEPVLADVDFAALLKDALVVVQPRAHQQEVEVTQRIAPALPSVAGDRRQLGEALVNLLVNALEAMPQGGGVTISVAPEVSESAPTAQTWVRIDIADTGPGVPPHDFDRLFEPFFTTKASGSGLGLAIVHTTVERHGGTLSVRNGPEKGATFTIRLPAEPNRKTAPHAENPDRR
jgi:signal transduction histidine kinase